MFAQRLKQLRNESNITQQDMADFLGITRQGYAKYENKHSEPSYEMLQKIANFFEVTIDHLLGNPKIIKNKLEQNDELKLSTLEIQFFNELKKHPVIFQDLASNPEQKVKELIKLYKLKKVLLEDDDSE